MATRTKQQSSGRMLDILNQSINVELTVSIHYQQRSFYWIASPRLSEMYSKEAEEERGHMKLVSDRLVFLGRQPGLSVTADAISGGSIKEQFLEDLSGEVSVADQYQPWVREAFDQHDFVTMDIFKQILKETESHAYWIQNQISLIEQMGEESYLQTWVS
jgi:bacterioferritin